MAGLVRRQTVGREQKHAKSEKVGGRCLPLTRPGPRVYICESEAVRDMYSMHKVCYAEQQAFDVAHACDIG